MVEACLLINGVSHNGIGINRKNDDGNTPLHIAARKNLGIVVKRLLSMPTINCELRNNTGATPVMVAKKRNNDFVLGLILKKIDDIAESKRKQEAQAGRDTGENNANSKALSEENDSNDRAGESEVALSQERTHECTHEEAQKYIASDNVPHAQPPISGYMLMQLVPWKWIVSCIGLVSIGMLYAHSSISLSHIVTQATHNQAPTNLNSSTMGSWFNALKSYGS